MILLYTWRDVQATLAAVPDPPWFAARVAPDQLLVLLSSPGDQERASSTLARQFGVSFVEGAIELISLPDRPRRLPVRFAEADEEDRERHARAERIPARPLWSERPMSGGTTVALTAPKLVAFFSYKGGTGRTTLALAAAGELLRRQSDAQPRVLLVDADVEAPGLSWLLRREDRISLLDTFGLLHDADDWQTEALPLIAEYLRASRESVELPGVGRREFLFMPAMRDIDQVFRMSLTPEQLIRAPGRASLIGDFFLALADKLDLDAIFIDLRAGITEFSSPLLLDPRVQSVLVTSCNQQSVDGTVATLRHMRAQGLDVQTTSVVISLIPPESSETLTTGISETIFAAAREGEAENSEAEQDIVSQLPLLPHLVPFAQELLHFHDVADLLGARIPGTRLGKEVAPTLVDQLVPRAKPEVAEAPPPTMGPPTYGALHEKALQLEFAEENATLGLLPIPALKNLIEQPAGRLPAVVALGAKGAGKTFAWGQMVLSRTWEKFCREIRADNGAAQPSEVLIFPLLHPKNLHDTLRAEVQRAEDLARRHHPAYMTSLDLAAKIEGFASRGKREGKDPMAFWLEAISARLGLKPTQLENVRALEDALRRRELRVILVLDGIEDALQLDPKAPLQEAHKRLLRVLLQDLTNSVRELQSSHLGLVTFIRRDFASDALSQNFRQFESLHRPYSLQWSPTEALRLPIWLCQRLAWELLPDQAIDTASYDELKRALFPFWGEKMGKNRREPFSDEWVIAALSDLNGRIQARDLVRLIRFATENDPTQQAWPLPPKRLRDALAPCAVLKVEELQKEIRNLEPILDKLRRVVSTRKTIPFVPRKLADSPSKQLKRDEVQFLEDQGLITRLDEGEEYYMPEIIRQSLGFKLTSRRAKVLTLYRTALAKGQS